VTTATVSRSLPVCRIGEDERPKGPADHPVVGDRRVVWSTGSAAGAVRTRGRRRLLQRVGFVAASAAAVATLASVVSTWSIIGPVGSDPATALWIAPVSEVDGGSTTRPASTLVHGTAPDARSAFPNNSPLTRPSAQPATLVADSAAGSSGSGSTDDPDTGPIIGRDNGKGLDRRSERPSTTSGKAGTGAKLNGRPDSSDLSNLGSPASEPGVPGAGSGDSGRARSDRALVDALDCVEVRLSAPGAPRQCGRSGHR
jgi:hypothetical protein